jgi:chemotaxis protein MotB
MERKKKILPSENQPVASTWLLSYADMMTLIACFFILMMAFANYDPVGFTKKTVEVSKHFNKDKYKSSETKLKILHEEIAKHPELVKKFKVSIKNDQLFIKISGSTLFKKGEYELTETAKLKIDALIDLIKNKDANYKIITEGHTDNIQPQINSPFSSNWGLSSARASSIIQRFEYFGFDPLHLAPLGMSDTQPLLPNENDNGEPLPQNQSINNRVIIKVIQNLDQSRRVKMGLGIYFKD